MNEQAVMYKSKVILAASNNDTAGVSDTYNEYYNYFYTEGNPYYLSMLDDLMYFVRDTLYQNNKSCDEVLSFFDMVANGIHFETENLRAYAKFVCRFKFATSNEERKELINNIEPICPDVHKRELQIYKLDIANSELNVNDIFNILNYLKELDN